jgi:organic radical activating enzyme
MTGSADIFDGGRKLPVMEEFYSIQGEGFNMGKAAYFLRIGGCDVGCSWCDSKESWNADLFPPVDVDPIIQRIVHAPAKTVVITGGEPSNYPLDYLTSELKRKGVQTMIETSGTNALTGQWDWICLSPKQFQPPLEENLKRADELKVIIQKPADLKWAEKNALKVSEKCLLFLQPEWSVVNEVMETITGYVMDHPEWRVSLQAHKYMNIP